MAEFHSCSRDVVFGQFCTLQTLFKRTLDRATTGHFPQVKSTGQKAIGDVLYPYFEN